MTCIVGIVDKGVVYVGGDSAGVDMNDLSIIVRADEKVFITDPPEFVMGFCGSFRVGQLLRYALITPEQSIKKDDMSYMVTDFVDAVRTVQRDKGSLHRENDIENLEAGFIVGYKSKLYVIEADFQVLQPVNNYVAIGTGAHIALGAMYATKDSRLKPEERVRIALEAAVEYSAGVRPPFNIVKLEPQEE